MKETRKNYRSKRQTRERKKNSTARNKPIVFVKNLANNSDKNE